jgi:hypothetical protein
MPLDIHPHYEFSCAKDYMPKNWYEASVYLEHAFYHTLNSENPKYSESETRRIIIDARERINEAAKEADYRYTGTEY